MDDIDLLLDSDLQDEVTPTLKPVTEDNEDEIFLNAIDNFERTSKAAKTANKAVDNAKSVVHDGETDSSDDEENRNHEYKYNECGKSIKHLLQTNESNNRERTGGSLSSSPSTWNAKHQLKLPEKKPDVSKDVYTDPIFGIRIIKPLISQAMLKERMQGREAISMAQVAKFLMRVNAQSDWVIAGVIVHKLAKTSQKGKAFAIWTLSDLHGELKTVSLFLFGSAYNEMWKLSAGTVIGVLNPNVFEKKEGSRDEACLSVDNYQRIMVFGQSKDLGTCKSKKKSGEQCTAFVNVHRCEFCIFHIKQEYQKCSGVRSELQANYSGRGLTALRNKVLGKNEVFYGGKSFSAIPAAKSKKLSARDENRMSFLSGMTSSISNLKPNNSPRVKAAVRLEPSASQRAKDLELLKRLGGEFSNQSESLGLPKPNVVSAEVTLEQSKSAALTVIERLKSKNQDKPKEEESDVSKDINNIVKKKELQAFEIPLLSGLGEKTVDLSSPISKRHVDRAKLNALKWVQRNGPIKAQDPNSAKADKDRRGKKRALEETRAETDPKKARIQQNEFFSERFKKMMAATSKHQDLLEDHQNEEQEKYFNKLEIKERMEEKMLGTFKIECKAVKCLKCKYTNFSASDLCKQEKHPLKVYDAFKRFFKCGDCGNRTVTLDVVPTRACKNCGSGKWERTSMMREKKVTAMHSLSIRGGEQKFANSVATNANLDLLVPE